MARIKRWLRRFYATRVRRDEKVIACYDYLDRGGEQLRLDYPLKKESLVIDAGGYIGDFAAAVTARFGCRIDVFEPVAEYAGRIRERLSGGSNVHVIQAGLGASDREEMIHIEGLDSSVFGDKAGEGSGERVRIVSAVDYIRGQGYSTIDLMKINIEGGEYELLHALLDDPDMIKGIRYLQVQFHDFIPDAKEMRAEIRRRLSETHELMWDFPFIWESWQRVER